MKRKLVLSVIIICLISIFSISVLAEGLIDLSVKEADIRDVLKMMGEQGGVNVVPDPSVRGQVTLTLNQVTVEEALEALLKTYAYNYIKSGERIYLISQQVLREPYLCDIAGEKMTLIAQAIDLKRVVNDIATKGKLNIIYDQSINGQVNANLIEVDLYEGLKSLCTANNLLLSRKENIYTISSLMGAQSQSRQYTVSIVDGLVSINARNGEMTDIIRAISEQSDFEFMLFNGAHMMVDLNIENVPIEEAIKMMLSGTRFSYRKDGNVFLIGDKSINSPSSSLLTRNEVIKLKYLQAEKVPAMLPNVFPATNIKVIKELNALAVTGTQEDIADLMTYLDKIDQKIPQIVVEAIIIQVSRNTNNNPLFKLQLKAAEQDGGTVLLDTVLGKLTYNSVIKLKPDFYITLENLVAEGAVTVKARPKITTLNGYQAKINVGNVQYYKTTTNDNQQGGQQQTQYQSINAGITLDVVPWVSSTGEITLDLHPNVSNLGGASSDGPPLVTQRQVDTTVRVKDGQTIIIGGLIQDVKTETLTRVPFLGYLPWVGKFFTKKTYTQDQNELIIYITPHILNEEEETITSAEIQSTIEDMEERYQLEGSKNEKE